MLKVKEPIIITIKNVHNFLLDKGFLKSDESVSIREIVGAGVSSTIIEIKKENGKFILKQPLTINKIGDRFGVANKTNYPNLLIRNLHEQDFIDLLNSFLRPGIVPEIHFRDRDNFVFIMSCAPDGFVQWKKILLDGQVNLNIGVKIGKVLAKIHNNTAHNKEILKQFQDKSTIIVARIDPFFREIQKVLPEFHDAIQIIIDEILNRQEALCTVDFNPKNTLIKDEEFILLDHEGAHYGDPSFDIGLFLAHIFLKSIYNWQIKNEYFNLARSFWNAYCDDLSVWQIGSFERRVVRHIAAAMLARIVGKLPVEYLSKKDKAVVLSIVREGIFKSVYNINDFIDLINSNLSTRNQIN